MAATMPLGSIAPPGYLLGDIRCGTSQAPLQQPQAGVASVSGQQQQPHQQPLQHQPQQACAAVSAEENKPKKVSNDVPVHQGIARPLGFRKGSHTMWKFKL